MTFDSEVMMGVISIRISDEERKILELAAKAYGGGISSMIRQIVFEKIEDDYDLSTVKAYEERKAEGRTEVRPISELWDELDLNDAI